MTRVTRAIAAGLIDKMDMADVVKLIDEYQTGRKQFRDVSSFTIRSECNRIKPPWRLQ